MAALVAMLAFGLAFAPTGSAHRAGAAGPLRMTVGTLGPIGSLDPRHGDSVIAREVWNLQYPTLTTLDPQTLDPTPGLAAAWSPIPDGRGWIYDLRPGLTWSDGQPVTAADVVYSLDRARDDHWPYAAGMFEGLNARALNSHSVEVTSTLAEPLLPGLLLHVVPAHVFSNVADLDTNLARLGVSDGAWHVVDATADSVELDATNRTAGPALQQIVLRTYTSADALIGALAHGQVDVISAVPFSDLGRLETLAHVTVDHASDGTQYLLFDHLPNARVRQAISLAIDRTELVAQTVDGVGTPGVVPLIANGASWALDDPTVESLTAELDAQPDRARAVVATQPIAKLTFSAPTDATSEQVATFIRNALAGVGIQTTASPAESPAVDLSLQHATIATVPTAMLRGLTCDICAATFRQYSSTTDVTTRLDAAHLMLQRAVAQATVVGLFQPDTLQAFRNDLFAGFLPEPQERSLVVFGPTVAQYGELSAAPPPPGEGSSNATYAVGAVVVLALCAAAYGAAEWIRHRFSTTGDV